MSGIGLGCVACGFKGWTARGCFSKVFPCDRCGGHAAHDRIAPEDDWRPCPSADEAEAHNARSRGEVFGWWLCDESPSDPKGALRAVQLLVEEGRVFDAATGDAASRSPDARYRPTTRRGVALPWPEAPQ